MPYPSDHLLRTLAAVPVSSNILDVGCGTGRHTEPLLRLGFPVHACDARPASVQATRDRIADLVGADTAEQCVRTVLPDGFNVYPDDAFDWIVAFNPVSYLQSDGDLSEFLRAMRRLLAPGGWLYIASTGPPNPTANGAAEPAPRFTPDQLDACAREVDLALAVAAERTEECDTPIVRAIFRYVTEATPR